GGIALLVAALFFLRRVASDFKETLEQLAVISIPALAILVFRRRVRAVNHFGEGRGIAFYRASLRLMIKHRYAFSAAGLLSVILAVFLLNGIGRDFLPETDEGSILYMPSTLPGLPNREAGWVL